MTDIVLATLNARYAHASLGLRYLRANLGALRERVAKMEDEWLELEMLKAEIEGA